MNAKKKTVSKGEASGKTVKKLTFEEAFSQLEEVVNSLESSQLGLTESLALYQKGVGCLKVCHQALEQAERKIELLTGVGASGEAETEDFDDEEVKLEEKAGRRSVRRGASKSGNAEGTDTDGMDEGLSLF